MRTGDITLDRFLTALKSDRESMKHLRIGQWLVNAAGTRDLFYMENDELIARLEAWPKTIATEPQSAIEVQYDGRRIARHDGVSDT